jgi:hypothetical protein
MRLDKLLFKAIKIGDVIECIRSVRSAPFLVFGETIFQDVEPRPPRIMAKLQRFLIISGSMRRCPVDAHALISSPRFKITSFDLDQICQYRHAETSVHLGKVTSHFHGCLPSIVLAWGILVMESQKEYMKGRLSGGLIG